MKVNWVDDFGALYKQQGQQKHGIRLLALWKIQSGMTETEVCRLIGKTHATIRLWRRLYERDGLKGLLRISPGRGPKPKLDLSACLADDLALLHESRKGGRIRCQDIIHFVYEKYGVEYKSSGMYEVLHRLGFSWVTSRSKSPKHDPESITAFKKTLSKMSKISCPKESN